MVCVPSVRVGVPGQKEPAYDSYDFAALVIMIVITANRGDSAKTDHQRSLKAIEYWSSTLKGAMILTNINLITYRRLVSLVDGAWHPNLCHGNCCEGCGSCRQGCLHARSTAFYYKL